MSCSQTLNGLPSDCATSRGGIKRVLLANYSDISVVEVGEDNMIKTITMNAEAKFKQYNFRRGTGSMTYTATVDNANGVKFITTNLVMQFSRMETAKRIEIEAMLQGELVAIVEDCNGIYWYLGYDSPILPSASTGQTGTASSDGNFYNITLQDESLEIPYQIDPSIIEALIG